MKIISNDGKSKHQSADRWCGSIQGRLTEINNEFLVFSHFLIWFLTKNKIDRPTTTIFMCSRSSVLKTHIGDADVLQYSNSVLDVEN